MKQSTATSAIRNVNKNVGETEWCLSCYAPNVCASVLCTILLVKLTPGVIFITFLKQFFSKKVLCATFLYLQFLFVFFFWKKAIVVKASHKMLVKLIPGSGGEMFS